MKAASANLVIAEVYGGGGNSGATYQNDYVVIFNRGSSAQSVNGWSIQYQTAAGTTWSVVPLANTSIQPGAYHLIQLSGGATGLPLPTPDTIGTLPLNATQAKVALVSSTTALGSQCPGDSSVIDKIGYGSTSQTCSETANSTAPANNSTSMQRKNGGCQDSDDNSADFEIATPNPRNSASASHLCGGSLIISSQPQSRTNVATDFVDLSATVIGTPPVNFQWFHDNNPVAIGSAMVDGSTNVISADLFYSQTEDEGNYFLVASNQSGSVTSTVAFVKIFPTPDARIARWDFNFASLTPSEGSGFISFPGNPGYTFPSGTFSDPIEIDFPVFNNGLDTSGYPASGTGNKMVGVQFNVGTSGYKNILLTWEQRHSATASKYLRLQYSADGFVSTTNDYNVIAMGNTNATFSFFSSDLSGISAINDNPNFAFRFVTEFQDSATGSGVSDYVGTTGNYGTGGTIRYDLVSVYGNLLGEVTPIPLSVQRSGPNVILTWSDPSFALQAAPSVTGTYTNIPGATSPYPYPITSGGAYFRLIY